MSLLQMVKASLKYCNAANDNNEYWPVIEKEKRLQKKVMDKILGRAA